MVQPPFMCDKAAATPTRPPPSLPYQSAPAWVAMRGAQLAAPVTSLGSQPEGVPVPCRAVVSQCPDVDVLVMLWPDEQ